MKYKRILLKLSGEALMGEKKFGIDSERLEKYSTEIKNIKDLGIEVAIVIGGGNIFRGIESEKTGIDRVQGDYMGMLATVINSMALQSFLEKLGCNTRLLSGFNIDQVCEPFIRRKAIRHLEKNRIVIFAAGTGNPFFSTDTAASLRASEMNCSVIIKATKVDGIFDKDPKEFNDAKFYDKITYSEVLNKDLRVMDATAISLAKDSGIPILITNINRKKSIIDAINNIGKFSKISYY